MLFKFQWQKEKLFEQPRPGLGFVSIPPNSTNDITGKKNSHELKKYVHVEKNNFINKFILLKMFPLILIESTKKDRNVTRQNY